MFAVVVHAGAGFHARSNELTYMDICSSACNAAVEILKQPATEYSAIDAATAAVTVLEDSHLTNAGFGSCLNIDGNVECDAGLMCGRSLKFTSVASVRNIKNPIKISRHLLVHHLSEPASAIGRVKPLSLCSDGARRWATDFAGLPLISNQELISEPAKKKWLKYKRLMERHEDCLPRFYNQSYDEGPICLKRPRYSDRLDTVGAVCLDATGNICAASSSGGIPLKSAGRIGQASVYGCGSWAEVRPSMGVGCVTSGTGEQLIRTQLAQRISTRILDDEENAIPDVVNTSFQDDFLYSRFLSNEATEKYGGVAGIAASQLGTSSTSVVDLFFKHSTDSLAYAYFVKGITKKPKTEISRKTSSASTGSRYYAFCHK